MCQFQLALVSRGFKRTFKTASLESRPRVDLGSSMMGSLNDAITFSNSNERSSSVPETMGKNAVFVHVTSRPVSSKNASTTMSSPAEDRRTRYRKDVSMHQVTMTSRRPGTTSGPSALGDGPRGHDFHCDPTQ